MPANLELQDLMSQISVRLEDMIDGNESMMTMAFSLLIVDLFNRMHPPSLSKKDVALIKQNCSVITQADIKKRSLSEDGLRSALSLYQMFSAMIMDYSPLTNCQEEVAMDTADVDRLTQAQAIVDKAYADIVNLGYSTLGAASSLAVIGIETAVKDGASGLKLARIINELMGTCIKIPSKIG